MDPGEEKKRITAKPSTKETNSITFTIENEDHTLGNLLAGQLGKNPSVQYAGYRIVHPSKDVILLSVQRDAGVTMVDNKDYVEDSVNEIMRTIDKLAISFKKQVESLE